VFSCPHPALTAVCLVLLPATAACTQQPADTPPPPPNADNVLSVQVRVVAVTALVRDSKNQLVNTLNKEDFTLLEDKKPQTLRYFNRDNDLPLMIGLMVDTSGSETPFFDEEAKASGIFLRSMLTRPEDKAFVVRFDTDVLQLQKVTSELPRLEHALTLLQLQHDPRPGRGGGTLLWDAVCAAAQQVAGKQPGRRALVVMTDGDDNGSIATLDQAIELSQMADTAVYSVLYSEDPPEDPFRPHRRFGLSGAEAMQHLSQATGGRYFRVSRDLPIDKIYAQIEQDLRTQYRLGYTPPPSAPNKYHSLEVQAAGKHLKVQARAGYYTPE